MRRPCRREALLGPAKPSFFQCLLRLGQQNHLFCNARRLGVLICSTLAIFEAPGASRRSLLLNSGDLVRKNGMFLMSGSQILHKLHFRNAKIHQTPLTSKSKENTREQTNITQHSFLTRFISNSSRSSLKKHENHWKTQVFRSKPYRKHKNATS